MNKQEINELIINNENLAYYIANKYKLKVGRYIDFDELKSICLLGLVKAGNAYDIDRKTSFSSFACKVIINEVLWELRKMHPKKYNNTVSLDDVFVNNLTYLELLVNDNEYIEDILIVNEENYQLMEYINELPNNLKDIVLLRLQGNTQNEIAKILNTNQPQVSRLYKKAVNILRQKFKC